VGDSDIDPDRSRRSSRQQASSHEMPPDSSRDEIENEAIGYVTTSAEHLSAGDTSVAFLGGPQRLEKLAEQKATAAYPIKCICTYGDGGSTFVRCDSCETAQHIECYYPNQNAPDLHLCADCEPRPSERKSTIEGQKYRREQADETVKAIEEHIPVLGR
jgi:hypothetical protein